MEGLIGKVGQKQISGRRISENIGKFHFDGWYWYQKLKDKVEKSTGKHLLFSKNFDILEKIAIDELENNGFYKAKIIDEENKIGDEFVLCIFDSNDSRKNELIEKYRSQHGVRCGFWKSNKHTSDGKYSKKFLDMKMHL